MADSSSRRGREPRGLLPRRPSLSPRNSRPLAASLASGLWEIETQENTRRRCGTSRHLRGRPSVYGHIGPQRGPGPEAGRPLLSHLPKSGCLGGSRLSLTVGTRNEALPEAGGRGRAEEHFLCSGAPEAGLGPPLSPRQSPLPTSGQPLESEEAPALPSDLPTLYPERR